MKDDPRKKEQEARAARLYILYAKVFGTQDGKSVLENLEFTWPPERPRFGKPGNPQNDPIVAARLDGMSEVVRDIKFFIEKGNQIMRQNP